MQTVVAPLYRLWAGQRSFFSRHWPLHFLISPQLYERGGESKSLTISPERQDTISTLRGRVKRGVSLEPCFEKQ